MYSRKNKIYVNGEKVILPAYMEECGVGRIISAQHYVNAILKETSAYLWACTIYIMSQAKEKN